MNSLFKICWKCGYSSLMNINTIPIGDNNNHIVKEIKIDLEKGYKFLNTKQVSGLKPAHEESHNRNMNMLSHTQILINNYDELIKYYNKYNIVESVKIEDIKSIKTITDHTHSVYSLLHLKDGRVASCSHDNTIRIYVPSNVILYIQSCTINPSYLQLLVLLSLSSVSSHLVNIWVLSVISFIPVQIRFILSLS